MLYIASDHAGFELKNKIIGHLQEKGIEIRNEGPFEFIPGDDYPDYIIPLMKQLQNNPQDLAITVCKNGVGVSILANKFKGIRAALSWNPQHAVSSRKDDNANVLSLPAGYISEVEAFETVIAWLNTPFTGEERHERRLNKIKNIEEVKEE